MRIDKFPGDRDDLLSGVLKAGTGVQAEVLTIDGPVIFGDRSVLRRSKIGRYFACGSDCRVLDTDIGAFCSFGDNVLVNAGAHPKNWVTTHLFRANPKAWSWASELAGITVTPLPHRWRDSAVIGHDVWLGANTVIRTGVTIGTGAIVGANSVVTEDVPEYAIVAGAPAKIRSYRFDQDLVARLLKSQWWSLPAAILFDLPLDDPERALERIEQERP